jgi:intracellular sulfur oxidation DsrE/DsrF family protein
LEDEVNALVRDASLNATPRFPEVEETAVVATGAAEEVVVGTTMVARVVGAADVVGAATEVVGSGVLVAACRKTAAALGVVDGAAEVEIAVGGVNSGMEEVEEAAAATKLEDEDGATVEAGSGVDVVSGTRIAVP